MDDQVFDEAIEFLLYGTYPQEILNKPVKKKHDARKNYRKKMKKYDYHKDVENLFYHVNNTVWG